MWQCPEPVLDSAAGLPDTLVSVRKVFGIESDWQVPAFRQRSAQVPEIDADYCFDTDTTLAVLAGFAWGRRVLVQGYHGTGKSTHIEQVAGRLNWPCLRLNLDGHVSRVDLIGRDAIVIREGQQVTEFREGILPWALQRGLALVLDEYDAGRPDVLFVLQRVLEAEGRLLLLEQNRLLAPHPAFRLFATANTLGLGDATGQYHGTQLLNQGQMDRWQLVASLNWLAPAMEARIVSARVPALCDADGQALVAAMVALAGLVRNAFVDGKLSTVMSPRTVISWAENLSILGSVERAFQLTYLNRCEETERPLVAELYQRCLGHELPQVSG